MKWQNDVKKKKNHEKRTRDQRLEWFEIFRLKVLDIKVSKVSDAQLWKGNGQMWKVNKNGIK